MIRSGWITLAAAGSLALLQAAAIAQPPGGGMPPEIAAKIKLWQKYRETHKKQSGLSETLRKVEQMNKEDDYKLDKAQSGKMLSIITAWSKKGPMTEDEATTVTKQINAFLTTKQIKKMTTMPNPFNRGGGGGGGMRPGGAGGPGGAPGGGRPGGPGAPGGRMGGFTFPDPPKGGMNPFNAETLPAGMIRDMRSKSLADFKADLEKQSK